MMSAYHSRAGESCFLYVRTPKNSRGVKMAQFSAPDAQHHADIKVGMFA